MFLNKMSLFRERFCEKCDPDENRVGSYATSAVFESYFGSKGENSEMPIEEANKSKHGHADQPNSSITYKQMDDLVESAADRDKAMKGLTAVCGVAPMPLLICEYCGVPAGRAREYEKYSWAVKLVCFPCSREWLVCKECPNNRKALTKQAAIAKHRNFHNAKNDKKRKAESSPDDSQTGKAVNSSKDSKNEPVIVEDEALGELPELDFARPASDYFFQNEHKGRGAEALVCRCNFSDFDENSHLDADQQSLHIQMANLVSRISRPERELLAGCLAQVEACLKKSCEYLVVVYV